MKKRLMAVLTSLCMMSALMPAAAFATGGNPGVGGTIPGSIKVGGVTLNSGGVVYAKTDTDGNVITEGADEENYNIMWNGLNLTLNNAKIVHTDGCAIDAEGDLSITLEGNNTVSASDTGDEYEHFDKGLAAIHSTGDITINDGGGKGIGSIDASVVNTVGNHADGIRAAGDINLDNVEVTAEGAKNLENSSTPDYSNGICSDSGDIDIYDNANVTAKSGFGKTSVAGINAANGNVTIRGNATVVASVSMRTAPMNEGDGTKVDGIRANGDVNIAEAAKVNAIGNVSAVTEPEYSGGIYSETGDVVIAGEGTDVYADGGIATKGVAGIHAHGGNVSISAKANVEARVAASTKESLSMEGDGTIADGIRAGKNVDIDNATVEAVGFVFKDKAPSPEFPKYSGGIFSRTGNISIKGEAADVTAESGYGRDDIIGIYAEEGSVNISDKAVVRGLSGGDKYMGWVRDDADGIRALNDITINDATVYAIGGDSGSDSDGIHSEKGNVTIESGKVDAIGGAISEDYYPPANVDLRSTGICAEIGKVIINGGEVYARVDATEGNAANGIFAGGDVDINGGDIHADGAVSDEITYEPATNAAVLNLNNGSNGKSNKMRPEFSQGIFSEAGNENISGAETEVEACGGYAIKSNVAIGTAAGNILMNGGNVRAHGLEDEGAAYGVNAMKNTDGKGGDIIITGGVFSAAGNNGGISYAGDLKASPAAKHAIEMKTGDTIKYTNDVDIFEGHKAVDYKATYAAAKAIKGSPFKAETVVERNLVAEKQYFDSRVMKADAPAGGEQTDANKPGPKTGDDSNMALWAGILVLAADLYIPKGSIGRLPAIAVCGPFGAVKEQCSGLYAHTLAKRGFLTLAFDPSFTGESGGNVRYMASPDINTEDFQAAVDFLSLHERADGDRIGILGICGWGGMAINTAVIDTRVKATAAMTMYDMTRVNAKGYFDAEDSAEARYEKKKALNAQRITDYANGTYALGGGVVDPLPDDAPFFVKDYYVYYKTDRGYHERSLNSNDGWNVTGCLSFMNQPILRYSNEIRSAVLMVHGEKAHSCYFSKDAYADMIKDNPWKDNKELMLIPDAVHTDLYDGGGKDAIPFDKLESFFMEYLK